MDLRFTWQTASADLAIVANDLEAGDDLETAVIVSLFTDRRAESFDVLPDGHVDRRGWWGDDVEPPVTNDRIGSRLWLLCREKQLAVVLERAKDYAHEALTWLIEDRVASAVTVAAEYIRPGVLGLGIVVHRPGVLDAANYRFEYAWAAQAARG